MPAKKRFHHRDFIVLRVSRFCGGAKQAHWYIYTGAVS